MESKVRTVIIDDEFLARGILRKLVDRLCPELEIVGEADDVDIGFEVLTETKPELVFLDIHLENNNSFQLIQKFDPIPFNIIFISAHADYGVNAFKVDAIDYVLKPVDKEELLRAVNKYLGKRKLEALKEREELSIPVHDNDEVLQIPVSQICSCIADNNYTQIHTIDNKKYLTSKILGDIEAEVQAATSFVRIHRSILINIKHLQAYTKTEPAEVTMKNGQVFEISRRRKSEVLAALKNR